VALPACPKCLWNRLVDVDVPCQKTGTCLEILSCGGDLLRTREGLFVFLEDLVVEVVGPPFVGGDLLSSLGGPLHYVGGLLVS
jgi:hypothetical protein